VGGDRDGPAARHEVRRHDPHGQKEKTVGTVADAETGHWLSSLAINTQNVQALSISSFFDHLRSTSHQNGLRRPAELAAPPGAARRVAERSNEAILVAVDAVVGEEAASRRPAEVDQCAPVVSPVQDAGP
jgi:hypothetical protein